MLPQATAAVKLNPRTAILLSSKARCVEHRRASREAEARGDHQAADRYWIAADAHCHLAGELAELRERLIRTVRMFPTFEGWIVGEAQNTTPERWPDVWKRFCRRHPAPENPMSGDLEHYLRHVWEAVSASYQEALREKESAA